MAKPLIIVESPAKARTIEKLLGRRFTVRASMGHVRDLPKSQFGVDLENGFTPKYIAIRGKGDIIKDLRDSAKKASGVYLATDPDREGEAISWHLAELLGLDHSANRVVFREVTREAVEKALKQPRPIDPRLVDAQQARRILDRLVGYKLSPLLWRKVRGGLSAGRVQSVAVRLIIDREEEIDSFISEEYWTLEARLARRMEESAFIARYHGPGDSRADLKHEGQVRELLEALEGLAYRVAEVKRKERRKNPPLPFTTSSLQQEASRKLGFTVRRTMAVAQQLYEGLSLGKKGSVGLVTYIRTDSTRVADEARREAQAYIRERFGAEFVEQARRAPAPRAGAQDAHEAIRPTSVARQSDEIKEHLTRDQYKLYRLIWERFVASQMSAAVLDTVTVDIRADSHLFRATGSTVKFAGFMALYIEGHDEEEKAEEEGGLLPDLREGEELSLLELIPRQHFTQPPPRYTEAMLVKALEEKGIGRPSTYAPIIETIQQRGYVEKREKRFYPTELGRIVVSLLKQHFPRIIDVEFTARLEDQLDLIEEGERAWREVVDDFYRPFRKELEQAEKEMVEVELSLEESNVVCEKCGRRMVVKHGRYGKFLACPAFPECRNTRPIIEEVGVKCPLCGGEVVAKRTRRGRTFYGCNRYPECRFVTWARPVNRSCPACGAFLVETRSRRQGTGYRCVREECGYREEAAPKTP